MIGTRAAPVDWRQIHVRAMRARAFSLVDVLVTLAVISVLIGLLLPTLSGVRETTRQVICRSDVRQIGIGLALFADDRAGAIPASSFNQTGEPQRTLQVRRASDQGTWDGLGYLYSEDYLTVPGVFYCPSHTGTHPYSTYADRWILPAGVDPPGLLEILCNYQYRGGAMGFTSLNGMRNVRAALLTDALRTQDDFNHKVGTNVLRADLSANWFADPSGRVRDGLPAVDGDPDAAEKVVTTWGELDQPAAPISPP